MSVKIEREDLELDQMCRACLGNENELVDLFWKMDSEDRDLTLADIFMMCTPVEVFKEDGMPQKLCELCINNLTSAYEFRARCQQNDLILKSMLGNIENVSTVEFNTKTPQIEEGPSPLENDEEVIIKTEPSENTFDEDAEAAANLNKLMGGELESYFSAFNPVDNKKPASRKRKIESSTELHLVSKKTSNYKCAECTKDFNNYNTFHRHMQAHAKELEKQANKDLLRKEENTERERDETVDSQMSKIGQSPVPVIRREKRKLSFECGQCGERFEKKVRLNEHTVIHSEFTSLKNKAAPNLLNKKKKKRKRHFTKKKLKKVEKKNHEELIVVPSQNVQTDLEENFALDALRNEYQRLRDSRHRLKIKICSLCGKSTERIQTLKNHLVEHILKYVQEKHLLYSTSDSNGTTKNISFACNFCCDGLEFPSLVDFKTHLWDALDITTYKCKLCNKTFGNSSNFSKHKKVHGMHFYSCKLCRRKFTTVGMLVKHKEYHLDNEPIECCGKLFHFPSMWKKHIAAAHTFTRKLYKRKVSPLHYCKDCKVNFPSLQDQWQHSWSVHNKRHYECDCSVCCKKFRNLSQLKSHILNKHELVVDELAAEIRKNCTY